MCRGNKLLCSQKKFLNNLSSGDRYEACPLSYGKGKEAWPLSAGRTAAFLDHGKNKQDCWRRSTDKWLDMKNRWCTAYLKTGVTDKWIRANRELLGNKCLFISGERRDESKGRAKLPEIEYHNIMDEAKRRFYLPLVPSVSRLWEGQDVWMGKETASGAALLLWISGTLQLYGMYVHERPTCDREYETVSGSDTAIYTGRDQAGAYLEKRPEPGTAVGSVSWYWWRRAG